MFCFFLHHKPDTAARPPPACLPACPQGHSLHPRPSTPPCCVGTICLALVCPAHHRPSGTPSDARRFNRGKTGCPAGGGGAGLGWNSNWFAKRVQAGAAQPPSLIYINVCSLVALDVSHRALFPFPGPPQRKVTPSSNQIKQSLQLHVISHGSREQQSGWNLELSHKLLQFLKVISASPVITGPHRDDGFSNLPLLLPPCLAWPGSVRSRLMSCVHYLMWFT